jgi:hypothetical protein
MNIEYNYQLQLPVRSSGTENEIISVVLEH